MCVHMDEQAENEGKRVEIENGERECAGKFEPDSQNMAWK